MKKIFFNKLILIFLIIMCFSSCFCSLSAEEENNVFMSDKTETVYTVDEGLITGRANAICQMNNGSIWIGQYAGLTSYDGNTFTSLTSANHIDLTSITCLESEDNVLYIGSQTALIRYYDHNYQVVELTDTILSVEDIAINGRVVYAATSQGLFSFIWNYTERAPAYNVISDESVISVAYDGDDVYYVTSDYSCYKNDGSIYYDSGTIKCVDVIDGNVFLGGMSGNLVVNGVDEYKVSENGKPINFIKNDEDNIYIGCDDGLYIFDGEKIFKVSGLKTNSSIVDLMIDYQDNLWIVSENTGVSKISKNSVVDYFFKYNIDNAYVTAITKYDDKLFTTTDNGLVIIDDENETAKTNELSELLKGIRLRDIEIFDNKLYIATYDTEKFDVVVYDGQNISYINAEKLVEEGDDNYPKAGQVRVLCAKNDTLYIGTNYGLSYLRNGEIKTIETICRPLYIYGYDDEILVCFENGGLGIYDDDLSFLKTVEGSEGLTPLKCIMLNEGLLYSCSSHLYIYDGNTTRKINLDVTGTIVDLLRIGNYTYVCSDTGIYIFENKYLLANEIKYELLDRNDGLNSGLSSNASGFYDRVNNNYFFAASTTMYRYNLSNIIKDNVNLKIDIDSVDIDGEINYGKDIKVKKDASRVTFDIKYYNYLPKDNYTVIYTLDGFDDKYHSGTINDSRKITYTNLKGGSYVFHLNVYDDKGKACSNEITFNITKEKKLFEYSWAIIIVVVLGLGVVGLIFYEIYRTRMKLVLKKKEEYKNITLESIEAIAHTIDAKDKYTNGHSIRVGKYSRIIAERLGLDKEQVENIYYIALLHDIGKIAIPDAILNKTSRLTDEEFEIMKSHTVKGDEILSSISTIPGIAQGARSHHEKYDGNGYPDKLKGEDIPFIARIICAADCYDAMATKRTYKEPFTREHILDEFEKGKGVQFDPKIADVVVQLINEGKFEE